MRLYLVMLFMFGFSARGAELRDFLAGSTWCFADREGARASGRLRFGADGRGTYDVYDAPGRGGVPFTWSTWESWREQFVSFRFDRTFDPPEQRADVLRLTADAMLWTWSVESGGTVSLLNRCR